MFALVVQLGGITYRLGAFLRLWSVPLLRGDYCKGLRGQRTWQQSKDHTRCSALITYHSLSVRFLGLLAAYTVGTMGVRNRGTPCKDVEGTKCAEIDGDFNGEGMPISFSLGFRNLCSL
jgi:hypothetical protein